MRSSNSVHHVDIGGRKGSGLSEEVYEEGLIIPPLKLYDDGAPNEQLFAILQRNVPADSGSMPTWQFYVNGVRANGEAFALHQHAFGGMGGRPGDDGLASVSFLYNVRDVSIEWSEMETPVLYAARELIADSGGAGEFRGGLGQELILQAYGGRVKEGEPLVLSGSAGRMRFPPRGLLGGGDGSYGAIEVNGEAIAPSSSPNVTFHEGDVVRLRLPGGGGHGDPARRRPGARRGGPQGRLRDAGSRGRVSHDRRAVLHKSWSRCHRETGSFGQAIGNLEVRPIDRGPAPRAYAEYGDAIGDLVDRLGRYCSYCERRLPTHLAVEHMAPRSLHEGRELDWCNFLLGCVNCNSAKGNKDVSDEDVLWPDQHNTMPAIECSPGGFVQVAGEPDDGLRRRARGLIDLVALDRHSAEERPPPSDRDRRWFQREEAWTTAEQCRSSFERVRVTCGSGPGACSSPRHRAASRTQSERRGTIDGGMTVPYSDRLKSPGGIPVTGRTSPLGLQTSAFVPALFASRFFCPADCRSIHLSISLRRTARPRRP